MTSEERQYALFGRPVAHSLSPAMHNGAYREMSLRARYRAFAVETAAEIPRSWTGRTFGGPA